MPICFEISSLDKQDHSVIIYENWICQAVGKLMTIHWQSSFVDLNFSKDFHSRRYTA